MKEMFESVNSGLVGSYLKSVLQGGGLLLMSGEGDQEGRTGSQCKVTQAYYQVV